MIGTFSSYLGEGARSLNEPSYFPRCAWTSGNRSAAQVNKRKFIKVLLMYMDAAIPGPHPGKPIVYFLIHYSMFSFVIVLLYL